MVVRGSLPKEEFVATKQAFGMWIIRIILQETNEEIEFIEKSLDHTPTDQDFADMQHEWVLIQKSLLLNAITSYDMSDSVNGLYINGKKYWLDKATRVGLANSIAIEKAAYITNTVLYFNGSAISIEIDRAQQMLSLLELYALDCYRKTEEHKSIVREMTTIEDVSNYDYKQGYPEMLQFEV